MVPDNGVIGDDVSAGTDDRVMSVVPDNGVIGVSTIEAGAGEATSPSVDNSECLVEAGVASSMLVKIAAGFGLWRASESLSL